MRLRFVLTSLLVVAAAAPAAAQHPTGGAPAQEPGAASKSKVIVVSAGGFTLSAREDALLGRTVRLRGSVPASEAGRVLSIQRYATRRGEWVDTATATVSADGSFLARWRTDRSGRQRLRAVLRTNGARAASSSPELALTIYRPAMATWYGPGFYGRRTACGQRMSRTLQGVAHRTLPCGTKVALLYRGRTLVVPVVDRGPFRRGTQWDLTAATAQALGFAETDRLGAMRALDAAAQPAS